MEYQKAKDQYEKDLIDYTEHLHENPMMEMHGK